MAIEICQLIAGLYSNRSRKKIPHPLKISQTNKNRFALWFWVSPLWIFMGIGDRKYGKKTY